MFLILREDVVYWTLQERDARLNSKRNLALGYKILCRKGQSWSHCSSVNEWASAVQG
jgi:hypothetical protein